LNALELGGIAPGRKVLIWGAGPAGTLLLRASRALGAEACCIEPDPRRRALVNGVEQPPNRQADLAVVAVGDRLAYEAALACLGPRGKLVLFSGLSPRDAALSINANQLHYLEQSVVGAYGCAKRHGEWALELIASGKVPVRDMISHDMPLAELERALELVATRAGMKILLRP
jgi:L-iditol 2-dehydrogenase